MKGYGFESAYLSVGGCFLCPGLFLLEFPPKVVSKPNGPPDNPNVPVGYTIPGSMPVEVVEEGVKKIELVPFPGSSVIAPCAHPKVAADGLGGAFPDDWEIIRRKLLLLAGVTPGSPYSVHRQLGYAAGARVPQALTE